MKTKKRIIILLAIVPLLLFGSRLFAQEQIAIYLRGDLGDAEKLSKAYMKPFGNMFGNSLNGGWYNSAKPHKLFGFDVTFNFTIAMAPSSDKTFNVTKLGLQHLTPVDPLKVSSQSIAGSKTTGPAMTYTQNVNGTDFTTQFNLPKGAGISITPMPMIQASFGLPYNTEIIGRYFPTVDIPKVGKFGMWGIGIKNEFKEFIPGFKKLPFNVSFLFGYTKLNSEFDISYKPDVYTVTGKTSAAYKNQKLDLNAKGYTARILIGKSIPILTVYAGVGYSKSKTDFDLKGNYPFGLYNDGGTVKVADNNDVVNPISMAFDDSGVSFNAGLRIKLSVIAFHFDYTVGKYSLYNAGVGINFR